MELGELKEPNVRISGEKEEYYWEWKKREGRRIFWKNERERGKNESWWRRLKRMFEE